jgi:hypothetical protein
MTAVAIFGIATSAAADDQQFDLSCIGIDRHYEGVNGKPTDQQWKGELRIDLSAALFCYDEDCTRILPIYSISPGVIFLQNREDGEKNDKSRLDRTTGQYTRFHVSSKILNPGALWTRFHDSGDQIVATCTKAPFKPLPALAF